MEDDIERFFKDLEIIGINEKNKENPEKLHGGSMVIFGIINRMIDLAEEILVKNNISMPAAYSDCFPALKKAGLVGEELSNKLEALAKERGLFAHHYYDVNVKKVLKLSKEIYVVKEFVERVKKIVEKQNKLEKGEKK